MGRGWVQAVVGTGRIIGIALVLGEAFLDAGHIPFHIMLGPTWRALPIISIELLEVGGSLLIEVVTAEHVHLEGKESASAISLLAVRLHDRK